MTQLSHLTAAPNRRGILLAGGRARRLFPSTHVIGKQMLPVYDKPMVYYPLSTLMLAGIREILLISTPRDLLFYEELLGDGSQWGVQISYKEQPYPAGIPQAFLLAADFLNGEPSCLILGDGIFYGNRLAAVLQTTNAKREGATLIASRDCRAARLDVVVLDNRGDVIELEDRPAVPQPRLTVTGLYFYDEQVVEFTHHLKPSPDGVLEIGDLNRMYLARRQLRVHTLENGAAWLDTGTPASLLEAGNLVSALESSQGLNLACVEETAWKMGYISFSQLRSLAAEMQHSSYGQYLCTLSENTRSSDGRLDSDFQPILFP